MDAMRDRCPRHPKETFAMRAVLTALLLTSVLLAPRLLSADEPKQQAETKPPYQRLLQGDDAQKAVELEKKIGQLEEADQYAEVIHTVEELLALRRRVQGADHPQTVDQKWRLEKL